MNFKRVYSIAPEHVDNVRGLFVGEWQYFLDDVKSGITELYLIDEKTYYAIMVRKESLEIVLIYGENLREITKHVINKARKAGIKKINAWTAKKGMERIFKGYGAEHTATVKEYTLGI